MRSVVDLPIIISENGLGAFDTLEEDGSIHDPYRIAYLSEHLKEIKLAIEEGSEVLALFVIARLV